MSQGPACLLHFLGFMTEQFSNSISFSLKVSGNVCTVRTQLMGRLLQRCRGSHLPFLSDSKTKAASRQTRPERNLGSQVIFGCGHQFRRKVGQLERVTWKIAARFFKIGSFENKVRMGNVSEMKRSANYK